MPSFIFEVHFCATFVNSVILTPLPSSVCSVLRLCIPLQLPSVWISLSLQIFLIFFVGPGMLLLNTKWLFYKLRVWRYLMELMHLTSHLLRLGLKAPCTSGIFGVTSLSNWGHSGVTCHLIMAFVSLSLSLTISVTFIRVFLCSIKASRCFMSNIW